MKGKGATALLIGLVALVWGVIIYRVVKAYSNNDEESITANPVAANLNKEPANDYSQTQDTTKLLLNYRDPFSNAAIAAPKDTFKPAVIRPTVTRQVKTVAAINIPVQPAVNWAIISYTGYIRNPSSKKLLALVQVNGKELMMSEGETADQVRLLKNLRDSIKVSYQGKTKFIPLNTSSQ